MLNKEIVGLPTCHTLSFFQMNKMETILTNLDTCMP